MFEDRIAKLRNKLTECNVNALLVSNFYNILYLTGFKTLTTNEREGFVLVTKEKIYLFTDSRYVDGQLHERNKKSNIELKLIEPNKNLSSHLQQIIGEDKIATLGFEGEDLKFEEYQKLKERFAAVTLQPTERLIVRVREIKDEDEIKKIQKACEITDQCLIDIVKTIKLGISEKEMAFKIEMWIKEKGYDLAFDPIVAVDANAALPHYNTKAGRGTVQNSSLILIDFGVKCEDYSSDITRMVFFGKPKDEVANSYTVLHDAQEKAVIKAGEINRLDQIDLYCRKLITDKNLPTYPHSTGHGVGLEIHEYPKVSIHSNDMKMDGQVFTIEPGIYIAGEYGMRVEDTVVIKKGKAEVLTKFSKEPVLIS